MPISSPRTVAMNVKIPIAIIPNSLIFLFFSYSHTNNDDKVNPAIYTVIL